TITIPLEVAVPGAAAIADASVEARRLGNNDLADRLGDLSSALTNLVQDPTSAVFQGQALASTDSLKSQLAADAILAARVPDLSAARAALAAATTAGAVQSAVAQIGDALAALDRTLTDL